MNGSPVIGILPSARCTLSAFPGPSSIDELPSPSFGSSLPRAAKPARSTRTNTHFVSAWTFRVASCQGRAPRVRLSLALRSYRAKDSFSTQSSPSPDPWSAGATRRRSGGSPLRQELLRNVAPLPRSCFQPFGSRPLDAAAFDLPMLPADDLFTSRLRRVRTTASCLWLYVSPQRRFCFRSAIRGLSYPEPQPNFFGKRISPGGTPSSVSLRRLPHYCGLISHPLRERCQCHHVAPPRVRELHSLPRFHSQPGQRAIACAPPFRVRPAPGCLAAVPRVGRKGHCRP